MNTGKSAGQQDPHYPFGKGAPQAGVFGPLEPVYQKSREVLQALGGAAVLHAEQYGRGVSGGDQRTQNLIRYGAFIDQDELLMRLRRSSIV